MDNKYYVVSVVEATWKLNSDLSLIKLIHLAAERSGFSGSDLENCSDSDLTDGLNKLIMDSL
tara:strand:+ start:3789 stop:3974 length:186 start_codon:yes stop_codon:yes gene_type:complete